MKIYRFLWLLLLAVSSFAQTHTEVTVEDTQTITGAKTFSGPLTTPGLYNADGIIYIDGTTYARSCTGINAAITAVGAATSTMIFIPPGADIPCNVTINMDKPIILRGSGRASRIVPSVGFAGPVIKAQVDSNSLVNQYNQGMRGTLENIQIEDTGFRSQNTDGIWLLQQDEFIMQNVEVKWLKGYALQLDNNGANNTPVRESYFYNFISYGNGDPAQSKASVVMISNSSVGDEINEIRFIGGGVKNEWWEAVRIDTGKTCTPSALCGPRHIYFDNFQIEARANLDCAGNTYPSPCPEPVAVAPFSDNFHIVKAANVSFLHGSMSNAGQGKTALRIDGTAANPVADVNVRDYVIGGNPALTGTVNTSSTGNTVTWVSGNEFQPFDSNSWVGLTIVINSVSYTVASITDKDHLTLTTNPGNQSGVAYSVTSGGYGITVSYVAAMRLDGIDWLTNPNGNLNPTIPNTTNYQINETPGTPMDSLDVLGKMQCYGTECAAGFKNNSGTGQEFRFGVLNNGGAQIYPVTNAAVLFKLNNYLQVDGTNQSIYGAAAGNTNMGSNAVPWLSFYLGTAATNNFKFQPAATTGARIITIADPLSPTTVGLPLTIGAGTAAMTTAGILTGACGTTVTVAATGVLTTDVINTSHNAAATIGNGGGLTLNAWPTAGNVNFNYCNSSAGTITPTAMTINWQVTR